MKEKIKNWIENEYKDCVKFKSNSYAALTRSYGVLMFGANELVSNEEAKELGDWWSDEMREKFLKL